MQSSYERDLLGPLCVQRGDSFELVLDFQAGGIDWPVLVTVY